MIGPGEVVGGRWRVVRELGRGARGTALLADDGRTGERVVVRILDTAGASPGAADILRAQAGVLSFLAHRGLPRFVDFREEGTGDDTRLTLVTEFVPGESLGALVAAGRHFTGEDAVELLLKITPALRYLHGFSPPLAHGNPTPGNIILADDGRVVLTDPDLRGAAIPGVAVRPGGAALGPQEDILALGLAVLGALSHRNPDDMPRDGNGLIDFRGLVNVSDGLARVLGWMVEPDPARRYATVGHLEDDLRLLIPPGGFPPPPVARKSAAEQVPVAVFRREVPRWRYATIIGVILLAALSLMRFRRQHPPAGETPQVPAAASAVRKRFTGTPVVTTSQENCAPDEAITVTFRELPGNAHDWITIVPKEAAENSYDEWHYTGGRTEGEMVFKGLQPGAYEARLFLDWPAGGYEIRARAPFVVSEPLDGDAPVKGRLVHDGRPVTETTSNRATFWFRDEARNVVVAPQVKQVGDRFSIAGLQPGEYFMSIRIDTDGRQGATWPGDLNGGTILAVKEGEPLDQEVALHRIIRLLSPVDTDLPVPGWDGLCGEKTWLPSPVTFRWEGIGAGVLYDVTVDRVSCTGGTHRTVDVPHRETTGDSSVTVELPPSGPDEYYAFHLSARRESRAMGMFTTHGAGGLGWDYRFRVPD